MEQSGTFMGLQGDAQRCTICACHGMAWVTRNLGLYGSDRTSLPEGAGPTGLPLYQHPTSPSLLTCLGSWRGAFFFFSILPKQCSANTSYLSDPTPLPILFLSPVTPIPSCRICRIPASVCQAYIRGMEQ